MSSSVYELRLRESLGHRRSKLTVDQYAQFARRFGEKVGKPPSKLTSKDALDYIDSLIDAKRAPATIEWSIFALKRIYRAFSLQEPFATKDDVPRLPRTIRRQAMPRLSDVRNMIYWARRNANALETVYLVMSTVYGLRRAELAQLRRINFSHNLSSVDVNTLKHGNPRTHVIPEQVRPYLRMAFSVLRDIPDYDLTTVSVIYQEISDKSGHKRQFREGWHGIRRLIDTELLNRGVPLPIVRNFMRWSTPSGDMAFRYYSNDDKAIDMRVFKDHPLLEFWSK